MWIKKKEWKKLQEKIEKIKEQQQIDKEVFDFFILFFLCGFQTPFF